MTVHTFGELKENDIVKVSLDGLYEVHYRETGYLILVSIDGHEDWSFDPDEGEGWIITKVAKEA